MKPMTEMASSRPCNKPTRRRVLRLRQEWVQPETQALFDLLTAIRRAASSNVDTGFAPAMPGNSLLVLCRFLRRGCAEPTGADTGRLPVAGHTPSTGR